jgi:hypothetical protein
MNRRLIWLRFRLGFVSWWREFGWLLWVAFVTSGIVVGCFSFWGRVFGIPALGG